MMERKGFIGGSDIASVMGLSRWKSPLQLWAEKTGRIQPDDLSDNEAVELGAELEDFVAKKFERKTGLKVRRASKIYISKEHDFMRCQVDRLIEGTDELLEVKTCSAWKAKEWEGEDIPQEYILQVMFQLYITGRTVGWIACLIGGQKFVFKKIDFDAALARDIETKVLEFWRMVCEDTPPMAAGMDNYFIADIHPESGEQVQAVAEMNDSIALLQQTKDSIKELEATQDEIEAKLKQTIGDNLGINTGEYVATWKSQHGSRVDVEALRAAKLYEQFSYPTKTRVLRIRKNKEA